MTKIELLLTVVILRTATVLFIKNYVKKESENELNYYHDKRKRKI